MEPNATTPTIPIKIEDLPDAVIEALENFAKENGLQSKEDAAVLLLENGLQSKEDAVGLLLEAQIKE